MDTITPMKAWMAAATRDEQQLLAEKAGTSHGHLYQLSSKNRFTSAALAGRIADASAQMHKASKGRLPKLVRTDLCQACRECPYAAKALGARAVVSDFPIVDPRQMEMNV